MPRAKAAASAGNDTAEQQIRKLWSGGARREAAEVFKAAEFSEAQSDAILADLPDLRPLISQ
ncbi:hypothetical protein NKJ71_16615 [Mesorhizobium sp. M0050]|uniref:hypothetical protein n=1 Tax=Mesorhizobium sp. M0050 TaxID=2956861 RepID=UPI0033350BA8